jgi:hypothetical protein
MDSDNSRPLRREAHPFTWSELTGRQRDAVETVAALLLNALEALGRRNDKEKGKEVEALDLDRRSQLAFIDGERGMGKTSVLLAVQRLLGEESIDKDALDPVQSLHAQRRRFVWLETLDMEPLPRAANLPAAILVRIREKLVSPGFRVPSRAAAFDELDEHEQTASDLQELETEAVLAWQGTDPRRAEHTDPTAYASEVVRSEHAGLRLNQRLGKVLNSLARLANAAGAGAAKDPIFIVPVDDFDLAPTRCLELLRIIRMVSTPRLFFLVAGNTRIAEIVLRLESEGDLAKLTGRHLVPEEARWLRRTGVEIAANNLRKLLPPEQRARLDEVDPNEALKFRASPESGTLGDAVDGIIVVRNNAPTGEGKTSLKSFLMPQEKDWNLQYAGTELLGGKPRQILDRILLFRRHKGEHGPSPDLNKSWGVQLLRDLAEDLQRETREHAQLDLEQRDRLLEMLDTSAGVRFDIRSVLKLIVGRSFDQQVSFDGGTILLYKPERARWVFRDNRERDRQRASDSFHEPPLPRHLAASITALHDLAISLWGGYVFPNSIHYQPEGYFEPVVVDWSTRTEEPVIRWHVPEWWTIRETDRFLQHWQKHASTVTSVDELAWAWLAAQVEVLMDKEHLSDSSGRSPVRVKALIEELAQEEPNRLARIFLRESALVGMALLLAPESGCSESLANELLEDETSAFSMAITADLAERVRLWRADSFSLLLRREVQDAASMRLLSALSPDEAIRIVRRGFENRAAYGDDKIFLTDFFNSKPSTEEQLNSLRMLSATAMYKAPRLVQDLEVAIVAHERRYASHPFNKFREGVFVPQETDIERQGSRTPQRTRRYP